MKIIKNRYIKECKNDLYDTYKSHKCSKNAANADLLFYPTNVEVKQIAKKTIRDSSLLIKSLNL